MFMVVKVNDYLEEKKTPKMIVTATYLLWW